MNYSGIWAVPFYAAEEFFFQHTAKKQNFFQYKNCLITLEKLPEKGILKIPQTQIVIYGDEKDTKEIYEKFFLNFLSAGG